MSTSTSPLLYAAESWEKVYSAFSTVNFTSYDYDAVKQSLLDYLKFNYPENFNDYIESSGMIALAEMFAYIAEQLSYRIDLSVHENLMPTAQRKQSILRLAKLISYTASRNLPLRGLVKINSVTTSEDVRDTQGNSLANRIVKWNDPNNALWKEQFFLVINRVLTQKFGDPFKSFQIDDTVFQQYEFKNVLETVTSRSSFRNGVLKFKTTVNGSDLDFELVPSDVDANGIFERSPNLNAYFTLLYGDDGYGDGSDTTGFMMYVKQGTLTKLLYTFDSSLPNRTLDIGISNVNDVDVWVQQVDQNGVIQTEWENVPNVNGVNLVFNEIAAHTKYEIETLENDQIRLVFGDGDFADIPTGQFNIWVRSSTSGNVTVPASQIVNNNATFLYTSALGTQESCTLTYSLTAALQNSSPSEDIEHIRSVAPSVYYSQNRMVNGQDYNSFFLKDPSILRLKAVNRTFAGQPKYIEWNDASGSYQNIKLFGNDLRLYYDISPDAQISGISARSLIDEVIEPALSDPGIYNLIVYAFYTSASPLNLAFIKPRTTFIEDSTQEVAGVPLQEKTLLQGVLDGHWYGEPDATVSLDVNLSSTSGLPKTTYAIVNSDTDQRIYDSTIKMVIEDYSTGTYSLVTTVGNVSGVQEAVIRQKRFGIGFNPIRAFVSTLQLNSSTVDPLAIPTSSNLTSADLVQRAALEETYTVEITDVSGAFSVYGSISGYFPSGTVGEVYTNGIVTFLVGFPPAVDTTLTIGDAFIIDVNLVSGVYVPTIYQANLTGLFTIIPESTLSADAETLNYSVTDPIRSWLMIIERFDTSSGDVAYWKITKRNFTLQVESTTTKFWFNQDLDIVDSQTKKPVHDAIRILKSNLDVTGTAAIGQDHVYDVVGPVLYPDGTTNFNALSITPVGLLDAFFSGDGAPINPLEFLRFIGTTDYVYFTVDPASGNLTPVTATSYITTLDYVDDQSGNYVRKIGRSDLDFMWQHFTPDDHLIDPSTSNIIDCYVLTRGYYSQVQSYLLGTLLIEPTPPTPLELRNTYSQLIESKMISDTVVMHSGTVKLIFGELADPELRATFRVVMSPNAKLTGDQIRSSILNLINEYFSINNWDFGQDFYVTELTAVIQQNLATEISTVVLVPVFPTNYFGDLFFLKSAADEVFVSCATLDNIEIIDGLDRLTLKQKP